MGNLHDKTVKKLIKEKSSSDKLLPTKKKKSLYEREVARRIGKVELDKIRPLDISEILRDIANGYGDKPPRPTISNDVMRMLKRIFDHGIKLDVTQFNPASPFRPKDAGGEEQAANDPMTEPKSLSSLPSSERSLHNSAERTIWLVLC
ncbi:hypothetical protein P4S72_08090 [Vibrio sp. PP-XX7]